MNNDDKDNFDGEHDEDYQEAENIGQELEDDVPADNVDPSAEPNGEMPDGN